MMIKKIRLQDLREEQELTQKEIAAFLYCDQSLYWNVNTNLNSSFKGDFIMKWLDMEPLRA